jgi:hypothetical protein
MMTKKCIILPHPVKPQRLALRARAVHRLARQKRWPAYVFAAVAQETPHDAGWIPDVHDSPAVNLAVKAAHILLLYISFTLID